MDSHFSCRLCQHEVGDEAGHCLWCYRLGDRAAEISLACAGEAVNIISLMGSAKVNSHPLFDWVAVQARLEERASEETGDS